MKAKAAKQKRPKSNLRLTFLAAFLGTFPSIPSFFVFVRTASTTFKERLSASFLIYRVIREHTVKQSTLWSFQQKEPKGQGTKTYLFFPLLFSPKGTLRQKVWLFLNLDFDLQQKRRRNSLEENQFFFFFRRFDLCTLATTIKVSRAEDNLDI